MQWCHRPVHRFVPNQTYIVTAATRGHAPFFRGRDRLEILQHALLSSAERHGWHLHAWAVLENHYHFVGDSPGNGVSLKTMVSVIHSGAAIGVNRLDGTPGRRVWFQYWDTCITDLKAYYARVRYVMENPVKHGQVDDAAEYPYCSCAAFLAEAPRSEVARVMSFGCSRVQVRDDF
jgi:putative transposase